LAGEGSGGAEERGGGGVEERRAREAAKGREGKGEEIRD